MENLLEILATPKQVGLLMGAGVSKACGLPNVEDLTKDVRKKIDNVKFNELLEDEDNVETILNKVQQLKTLISGDKKINELTIDLVETIEKDIKETIFKKLSIQTPFDKLSDLVIWLNFINGENQKEVFTLNYDLLVENALEKNSLPYFSGFIGNVKPFFMADSVDDFTGLYVKQSWTKLWKLHGSLNFKKSKTKQIFIENNTNSEYEDLLIYPSMDKYLSSRKAPFIAYLDRFRKYLLNNEKVLLILGYSFSDDHVNDIIINGLNNNSRLSVFAFCYDEKTLNKCIDVLGKYPNISAYSDKQKFVNKTKSKFKSSTNIGDFNNFITVVNSLVNQNKPMKADEENI
ncbi:SIR2 family protein [Lutibacter citreus]|uniref:SIR2 family protein n=1 Tax=Lutibacter citreus TaxID=2138210 RepID=UPI000DBE4A43|nr:SIR2 family protein [Lutibacter citreus]